MYTLRSKGRGVGLKLMNGAFYVPKGKGISHFPPLIDIIREPDRFNEQANGPPATEMCMTVIQVFP